MEQPFTAVLGAAGTILSTASLMPQVVRAWRTRSTQDISAAWLVAALAAMIIWIAYGSMISAPAIILVNLLSFLQCASILFIKLQNERASIAERS